jgi:hypothetical protein
MHFRELLARILGTEPNDKTIRFYSFGTFVFVRSHAMDSCWSSSEPHHNTDIARQIAQLKAEHTAKALNDLLDR